MLRIFILDNITGEIHEYGEDCHDSLIVQEDGSLQYYNLQNGEGTLGGGYSFCFENGTKPSDCVYAEDFLDIGGEFYANKFKEDKEKNDAKGNT